MANYKDDLDKANSNSNNAFYEEPNFKNTHTVLNKIWTDTEHIPEDIKSVQLVNNIYSIIDSNNNRVDIIRYIENAELVKLEGTRATFTAEKNLLKDAIPFDYGKNYDVVLKDSSDQQIPFGLNSWFIDTENGLLNFDKGIPIGYSQPFTLSFYRYEGRKANETLLRSDGSIVLSDSYSPSEDNSIATKKYVDNIKSTVNTIIENAKPNKPSTFENANIFVTSNRLFNGYFILSREPFKVAIEGDDIIITTEFFYNEEVGQIDVYAGDYNLTNGKSLYISKDIRKGYTVDYWTVEENKDAYTGIYANYYNIMKIKCVLPYDVFVGQYTDNLPFLSLRLVYTGKINYSSNTFTIGFEPENTKPAIDNIKLSIDENNTKISGVPTLTEKSLVKLTAKISNLHRFYTDKFIKVLIPSLEYERDLLPIDGAFGGAAIYENVNSIYDLGLFIPITKNKYTEKFLIEVHTYDVLGHENNTFIENFNVRIDTMERQQRVLSGSNTLPSIFGQFYDDNESLVHNNELQQLNGHIVFPTNNYGSNGIIKVSEYLQDEYIKNVEQGPDYSVIAADYRYYTIAHELENYVNAVIIQLEDYKNILFNKNTHSMINCTLQCKTSETGWLNANLPYIGVLNPVNNSDFAMSVAHSQDGKYYITFGDVSYKGTLYIRFGTNDKNVSFKKFIIQEV